MGPIGFLLIIGICAFIIIMTFSSKEEPTKNNEPTNNNEKKDEQTIETSVQQQTTYSNLYKREYLMTLNEKQQYWRIRKWADSKNLIVFTKVRLADLVSPRDNRNQTLFWKIQAKHIDFVVCDQNINVKCIIELQDRSHYKPERIERDKFVREVLISCGYKVIQTFAIQPDVLDRVCGYPIEKENPPCSV